MTERENPDIKNIVFGEKVNPISLKDMYGPIHKQEYLLEGVGKVSIILSEICNDEGICFCPIGSYSENKLNVITENRGEIKLTKIPRNMYELLIDVSYPNVNLVPRDMRCILSIGNMQFESESQTKDEKDEDWIGFAEWSNKNTESDSLIFDISTLEKIQIQFVK